MSYQPGRSGDGYEDGHGLHDLPPGNVSASTNFNGFFSSTELFLQQYHLPPHHDEEDDEEDERALLGHGQGPFNGPFDEPHSRNATPPVRPTSTYTLTESYAGDKERPAPPYSGHQDQNYSQHTLSDPTAAFGVPGRSPSPYERSEASSTEAWRQRQAPGADGLRRFPTRKVPLIHGSVLSVDYPVPSPVRNAIQPKYRNDLEGGSEEFTHLRCEHRT